MTDTNKDVKSEAKADDTDSEASQDQGSKTEDQGEGSDSSSQEGVDYKSELERVTKQLGKAEHKLEENRKKDEGSDDGGKVDIKEVERLAVEKAEAAAQIKIDAFSTDLVSDVVEEGIGMLAINADEAKLIEFHYNNTIQKSGHNRSAIMNDLRRSKLLANESVIASENTELAAALRSEQGKNKQGMAAGERKQSTAKIELTSSEETLAQRMYERGVKNGKMNSKGKPSTLEDARKELFDAKTQ